MNEYAWMDSDEAARAALAAAQWKDTAASNEEIQQYELSSRANVESTWVADERWHV